MYKIEKLHEAVHHEASDDRSFSWTVKGIPLKIFYPLFVIIPAEPAVLNIVHLPDLPLSAESDFFLYSTPEQH